MANLTLAIDANTEKAAAKIFVLGQELLKFAQDAVKSFAEQEKADAKLSSTLNRLGFSSKNLSAALREQASAFQETLGVSDDVVQGMQSMLLQFGVAPKDIESTTRAVLDYAEVTGKDGVEATRELMKFTQTGRGEMKMYGIELNTTDDKAADLNNVVTQLSETMGGAASEGAKTLSGQMKIAQASFDEAKESIGGFIVKMIEGSDIVKKLTENLSTLKYIFSDEKSQLDGMVERTNKLTEARQALFEVREKIKRGEGTLEDAEEEERLVAAVKMLGFVSKGASDAATELVVAERAKQVELEKSTASHQQHAASKRDDSDATRELIAEEKRAAADYGAMLDLIRSYEGERANQAEADEEASNEVMMRVVENFNSTSDETQKFLAKADEASASMGQYGANVGSAFVSGLSSEMNKMGQGGEFDVGNIIKSVIPLAIASAIGVAFPPALPFVPLITTGLSAVMSGMEFHDGGPVEKYHDGGGVEVPAILEAGEYVVPRKQVNALGGSSGVQRALGGGGGGVTVITALDARSFQERAGTDIGTAQARSLRQNRGDLAQILRRAGVNIYR